MRVTPDNKYISLNKEFHRGLTRDDGRPVDEATLLDHFKLMTTSVVQQGKESQSSGADWVISMTSGKKYTTRQQPEVRTYCMHGHAWSVPHPRCLHACMHACMQLFADLAASYAKAAGVGCRYVCSCPGKRNSKVG